jgi:hypothetical protein
MTFPSKSACGVSASPRSQVRALVSDLARMFLQQMFFWGCDAQSGGNLLVRLGGQRLAREHSCGEGSSRYRWRWEDGTVELHSFCAGWYPDDPTAAGAVFIRGRERFFDCAGGQPLEPGHYDEGRFLHANADEMLALLRPLLSWLADYERRVELLGNCFRARRTGNGQNGDGRRGVRGSGIRNTPSRNFFTQRPRSAARDLGLCIRTDFIASPLHCVVLRW